VADRARRRSIHQLTGRDARPRRASLPFFVSARRGRLLLAAVGALALPSSRLGAQDGPLVPRPWLDWYTAETEHFVFHYPGAYRTWTLSLAERIEGVREQVDRVVGYSPRQRVHVVVDDPADAANGYAFTPLDAPTIVLWPTPPNPREEIGNARVWQELLVTHEYAHVAHLVRPSRNRFKRLLWSLSPVPLGPIASNAPRWVLEGYATYVEGRITGSGRPNNAWRAAVIRQFALEGKLPAYGQLNATAGWEGGSFAYLVGSAYLEWLARRQGDSSIVALWRRMTAVTDRSFDQAFVGVYGASPAELYGRFSAEVTSEALAVERVLRREGLAAGTLVQRLQRSTGDPAVSPDGRYVALTIRREDAPSQLVVWKTADEPDTLSARRRAADLRRDPEDVPDRAFYPPPKKPVITLISNDGPPYETPRWFADNKHLLVTRRTPMTDGTLRQDLYVWSAEDGELSRVTRGAALRDADPSADGRWAAAVRCDRGWCDLVRVDLATAAIRVLRSGSVTRNYYRPRVSKITGEIVVSEQTDDRWRIAVVSAETGALRYADPDDGVTRYDATFAPDGRTIVATSEAGGIANLERIDATGGRVTQLTSVTGAAIAPDVAPDGSVWFLALHGSGYDLRRLRSDSTQMAAALPLALVLTDTLSPVLPPRRIRSASDSSARPLRGPTPDEQRYGLGPSRYRLLPGATSGFGGSTAQLALIRSDPVGRLGVALIGSAGSPALPVGGALTVTTRVKRTELGATVWLSHEAPSRELDAALLAGLDLARRGGALRAERTYVGDGADFVGTIAVLAEDQRPAGLEPVTRGAGIAALRISLRQRDDDDTRYAERLDLMGETGRSLDGRYARQRSALTIGAGARARALTTGQLQYGSLSGSGSGREQFVVGGFDSPLIDPLYDARRVEAPAYPAASAQGLSFASYRVAVPLAPLEIFYHGLTVDAFKNTLRSYGAEIDQRVPAIAALGTPEVDVRTGVARAVDEPVKGKWRVYLTLALRP
jgi:Tol biopolymer transport system component